MAKPLLPPKVRILGHDVEVLFITLMMSTDRRLGEADTAGGTIKVVTGQEASIARETLLHEALHFISDFLDLALSESQVTQISQGIFQFLRDNPRYTRSLCG